jgi:hypothetical protein
MTVILTLRSKDGSITTPSGIKGFNPYEVAVLNGFKGTESEWLASLIGNGYVDNIMSDTSDNFVSNKTIKAYADSLFEN